MAFPSDVIVECAFNNDIDESKFASTGYTDITQWVDSISGNLRGRAYELNRTEAGTISIELDNTDRQFNPEDRSSPYYPNVKAERRLRIRGNNMAHPNVAMGGGHEREKPYDGTITSRTIRQFFKAALAPAGVSLPVLGTHDPGLLPTGVGGYHAEITVPSGQGAGTIQTMEWYLPLEYGVRLAHSAYIWKVSGTEPASSYAHLVIDFYDDTSTIVSSYSFSLASFYPGPTPTVPTRRSHSYLPPRNAQFAKAVLRVTLGAAATTDIVYAVSGIQVELPVNLAPNISGTADTNTWMAQTATTQRAATQDVPNGAVQFAWVTGDLYGKTTIPHLIPGEQYTATMEMYKSGAGPNITLTADDGITGDTLSVESTWTQRSITFIATRPEMELKLLPVTAVATGHSLLVRKTNVQKGSGPLSLAAGAYGSEDPGVTTWAQPKPIFEGWVESWPLRLTPSASTMTITVNDRLSRLGNIDFENTLKETLFRDGMELIIPFNDNPLDAAGRVKQVGTWADLYDPVSQREVMTDIAIVASKGDIQTATYTLGVLGPTDDPAIQFNRFSHTQGYMVPIPFSKDYGVVPPPPAPPPAPTPPPPTGYTYTKTYYAIWSRSYVGDGSTRFDDSAWMYQGDSGSGGNGNQRSLIGFNYAAIMADLIGATVNSIVITLDNDHWYWNAGGTAILGTHNYSSKPATWADATVDQNLVQSAGWPYNGVRSVSLGVAIGNKFKAGTAKGIALGPAPSSSLTYYGYFRGATLSGKPYLTIQYTK